MNKSDHHSGGHIYVYCQHDAHCVRYDVEDVSCRGLLKKGMLAGITQQIIHPECEGGGARVNELWAHAATVTDFFFFSHH